MISRTQALLHGALFALFIGGAFVIAPGASAQSTAASGLIKEASAGLAVHAFEQVTIGQVIDLGASGHLKITYYASCLVETIDGGTVTVGSFGSRVVGGKIATTTDKKSCKTTQVATTASTAESGAAIERVMAFDPRDWSETTVSVARPRFQPSASVATPVKLRILMLDDPAPKLIWEGAVKTVPATYPASAPKLLVGRPYKVELVGADGSKYSSTFSIDPGYVTDNGSVASTVLVSP
jgi:hypothetical protein